MQNVVKFRYCRKCKNNFVTESRKYCDSCKIQNRICECGKIFKSKKYKHCTLCRNSKGNDGICEVCNGRRHIYYSSGVCTTCYKFITKYKIDKEQLKKLRLINRCQLCNTEITHSIANYKGQAVIDHDHKNGKVRGVLCVNCNIIEGMIRDIKHLELLYVNYKSYMEKYYE